MGIMIKKYCFYACLMVNYMSYQIRYDVQSWGGQEEGSDKTFDIYHINETNIFLIVKHLEAKYDIQLDILCNCLNWKSNSTPACLEGADVDCQCPCFNISKSICTPTTGKTNDSNMMLCSALRPKEVIYQPLDPREVDIRNGLEKCYDLKCSSRTDFVQCHQVAGCRWCSVDVDGQNLGDKSFCGEDHECHFGMIGHYGLLFDDQRRVMKKKKKPVADSTLPSKTIGIVAIIIASVIVAFVGLLVISCKQRPKKVLSNTSIRTEQVNQPESDDDNLSPEDEKVENEEKEEKEDVQTERKEEDIVVEPHEDTPT